MDFDLTGLVLDAVRLDSTILNLDLEGGWLVVIENDLELHTPEATVLSTASGHEARIVSLLERAVGTPLTSFAYTEDGHLSFAVATGEVRVAPLERYESWHFVGPRRERVIATPGGELAIWSAWWD